MNPNHTFHEGDYHHVCYCEHKNGEMPNNGILCGYNGEDFTTYGNCPNGLICTGPIESDPETKRVPSFRKEQLCSRGKSSFLIE